MKQSILFKCCVYARVVAYDVEMVVIGLSLQYSKWYLVCGTCNKLPNTDVRVNELWDGCTYVCVLF